MDSQKRPDLGRISPWARPPDLQHSFPDYPQNFPALENRPSLRDALVWRGDSHIWGNETRYPQSYPLLLQLLFLLSS